MSLKINISEIERKSKIVDDAITTLKEEFVGIDEQIDAVMSNVRVWYLYPQLQSSPCVINIFGMTGCGKTSLVRRIAQLLNIEKDLVYFNFCAINEQSSWEVEEDIEKQLDNERSNRMFVYDEFQYAATLGSGGVEKDNKAGLKPFWELLDTGILHKRMSYREFHDLFELYKKIRLINEVCPMEIVNGQWINANQYLGTVKKHELLYLQRMFNYGGKSSSINELPTEGQSVFRFQSFNDDNQFFITDYYVGEITVLYRKTYNSTIEKNDMTNKLFGMTIDEICELLYDICDKSQKGYDLNFHNSIIFVIANLDEAYDIAFDVNPDMSPDQFYKITKGITIVDIKKALQKRFRNEQIARLGNIHIIYPSFNSNAFKKIIDMNLSSYQKQIEELCGIKLEFDNSLKKKIFNEAVYPTQGTRPIFSTIHEIVKVKLPFIIQNICHNKNEENVSTIKYSYKNKKSFITVLDSSSKEIDRYTFTDNLRLDKLRNSNNEEQQANTAVHESGHFVVYSYLNGHTPAKLISKSTDKEMNGFMMHDYEEDEKEIASRIYMFNQIKICLGGYVAEGIIFGNDYRSGGSSNDLKRATELASKMVRRWGMVDDMPFVTSYLKSMNSGGNEIVEEKQQYINDKIKNIIADCLKETEDIIKQPHIMNMLKKASKYLATHSQMPKKMMNKLLKEAKNNGIVCANNENYYRNIVNNF